MSLPLETVVKQLEDSGVISDGKLENFIPPKAHPKDVAELVAELVKQNHLTKFQAAQVAAGKARSLILGGYTILDKIGAGGMGQVFKAKHRRMDRLVAIKMLPPGTMRDAAAVARFEREVKAAAKLRHPNIVAADDADMFNGVHFLVMEFVDGRDLSATVKKEGPLPVAKAVSCVLQAARGLEFAHSEGVVHRDIKPGNLLCDKKGSVKILDMGLARIETHGDVGAQAELTGSGAVMGTVDYMAPEQALSTKHADARADVYSLGCTLHYLLTGRPPYTGDTLMARLLAHRDEPIPSLCAANAEVPEALDAIFQKLMAKRVDERYQTMTELIVDLERLTGAGSSISSNTTGVPQAASSIDSGLVTFLKDLPQQPTKKSLGAAAAAVRPQSGSAPSASAGASRGPAPSAPKPSAQQKKKPAVMIGGGLVASVLCVAAAIWIVLPADTGPDLPTQSAAGGSAVATGDPRPTIAGGSPTIPWVPGAEREPDTFGMVPRPAVLPGLKSWQLETVRPRLGIRAVAWNNAGTHLACLEYGGNTTSIRIYEYVADNLVLRYIVPATLQDGEWLSWSPDGKRLVAGRQDRLIVWQIEGRTIRVAAQRSLVDGGVAAQWSPTGPWIAIATRRNVQLWNPDTQAFGSILELSKTTPSPARIAWRPDGARLAVEDGNKTIRIWDPTTGSVAPVLPIETGLGNLSNPAAFYWSPDGSRLAVCRLPKASEKNNQFEIWDPVEGTKKATLESPPGGANADLVFFNEGRAAALMAQWVPAWNTADGKLLGEQFKSNPVGSAGSLAVAGPQPNWITVVETRAFGTYRIRIGDFRTGKATTALEGLPEAESVAWNPDGRTIAIGTLDKTLRILSATDGATRTLIKNLVHPMGAIAWSADGRRLASGIGQIHYVESNIRGNVQFWDLPAGRKLNEITALSDRVAALDWSRDGKYLAVTGDDTVHIYQDGERGVFRSLPKPQGGIPTLVWSPDNRHLAVGSMGSGVTVYDALNGVAKTVVTETIYNDVRHERVAFSPSGDRFVVSSVDAPYCRVFTLDGKTLFAIPDASRSTISWSPDDRWIVAGHQSLAFYEAATGRAAGRVRLPQNAVGAALQSWSPDGKFLAFAQHGFTAGIVDAQKQQVVWTAILLPNGETAAVSAAGELIAAPRSVETELCYVCETSPDVFELLKPSEFQRRPPPLPATTRTANPTVASSSPPGVSSGTKSTQPSFLTATPASSSSPAGIVYLDDLAETEWKGGVGQLGKQGLDWNGLAFTWRGRTPVHSLLTHPLYNKPPTPVQASVAYAINAQYEMFAATVGLADGSSRQNGSRSPLTFRVLGDGRELWKSPPIQKPTDEATFSVSVAGVRELRLEVEAEASTTGAHAVWIEPRLTVNVATKPGGPKPWETPDFQKWIADVRTLSAEQQVEAVGKKLVELNPEFDGVIQGPDAKSPPTIDKGRVTQIGIATNAVTDISPLKVWNELYLLRVAGSGPRKGRLVDLSPLNGMSIYILMVGNGPVADISPLSGMERLGVLNCDNSDVSDLTPLLTCSNLRTLNIRRTKATATQVAALQKALPNCKIEWDEPNQ